MSRPTIPKCAAADRKRKFYVYQYERKGVPIYVSVWSDSTFYHAKDIEGHKTFCKWATKKYGGIGKVRVRILATDLGRKQAMLVREAFTKAYMMQGYELHSPVQGNETLVKYERAKEVLKVNRNANKARKWHIPNY